MREKDEKTEKHVSDEGTCMFHAVDSLGDGEQRG